MIANPNTLNEMHINMQYIENPRPESTLLIKKQQQKTAKSGLLVLAGLPRWDRLVFWLVLEAGQAIRDQLAPQLVPRSAYLKGDRLNQLKLTRWVKCVFFFFSVKSPLLI